VNKILNIASKIIQRPWFYPLALFLIGLVAYGLMLPRLGFYWDDWEGVYLYNLHMPALAFHYYAERPFSAIVFMGLFPFIKMTPVVMQSVALLLRLGGVLFVHYTLNNLWPERVWLNRWIGALLFVFPGFFNQQVATAFTPHLATFMVFSCSLYLTTLAIRQRQRFWLWMPLSVLLGLAQIFMMEYFVGLELTRPLIIWWMLRNWQGKEKRSLLRTLLYWSPFLAGLGVYFWWRLAYLPTTMPAADPNTPALLKAILTTPLDGISTLATRVYLDVRYLLINIWPNAFFDPPRFDLHAKILWAAWFAGVIAAILFGLYLQRIIRSQGDAPSNPIFQPIILGGLALLAGAMPVWMLGRQISSGKWSDRFALAPMIGAVIIVVYGIAWLFRTYKQKHWLLTILLAFSISAQIWNANTYRLDWILQRDIYWQFAWRVPALKPGTAIIGKGTFTDKSSYPDAIYMFNLLYDEQVSAIPRYAYFDVFHYPHEEYIPGLPLEFTTRSGKFTGDTSHVLGMYFNLSGGCVRIIDQVYRDDINFTNDMNSLDRLNQLLSISKVDQILVNAEPVVPEPAIFGTEPPHGWCYYFEKADLARQQQNWQTILQLGQEAAAHQLKPVIGAEYIPFIEAFAQTDRWSEAYDLSLSAWMITPAISPSLCNNWTRFATLNGETEKGLYVEQANKNFCSPPAE
jgi:hypothetical protein